MLTVYFLQNFEFREMFGGCCRVGDWYVVDAKLARNIEDVKFSSDAVASYQIAEYVKNEKKKLSSEVKDESYSVKEMAKYFCSQQRVSLDTATPCFLVRGLNNRLYTVQLYPEKCSCGSTKSCRHIEACNTAVGKPTNKQNKCLIARGKNRADRKFPRSNFKFQYTPAADSHSPSKSKHPFPLFTSSPKKNQSPVITSAQAIIKRYRKY